MTASYPTGYKSFPVRRDNQDIFYADHTNGVQDEVVALERTLGINPQATVMQTPVAVPDPLTVTSRIAYAELNYQRALLSFNGSVAALPSANLPTTLTSLSVASNTHGLAVNSSTGLVSLDRIGLSDDAWWSWHASVFWRSSGAFATTGERGFHISLSDGAPLASDTRTGKVAVSLSTEGYSVAASGLLKLANVAQLFFGVSQNSGSTWNEPVRATVTLLWEREG